MSCCYAGPKKKNKPPTAEYKPIEPEIEIQKLDAKKKTYYEADDPEIRLKKVEIKLKKQNFVAPPRGIDINISIKLREMKKCTFSENFGSKIMIAQQQQIHQKKLNEIYQRNSQLSSKTINYDYLMRLPLRNHLKISKKTFNEQMNHHLILKHLIQRLNSPKSYAQRKKDENDFIAHPSLFFRNSENKTQKKKLQKLKMTVKKNQNGKRMKKNTHDISDIDRLSQKATSKKQKKQKTVKNRLQQKNQSESVNSQMPHNGLTLEKVIKQLPKLQKFEQQDVELFAQNLTQIIFKYNLNSMEDIEFLFECVENYLPDDYPEHFINAIQDMFRQIVTSLNIEQ